MDTKRVRSAVDSLNYGWHRFSMLNFIAHVASVRQRPLDVIGVPLAGFSGLCLSTPRNDYIFYNLRYHAILQLHTQLHEIAHLMLGHTRIIALNRQSDLGSMLLHINTRIRVAPNDPFVKQEEDEAEYFAIVVQGYVANHRRLHQLTLSDHADDIYMPPFTGDSVAGD